MLEQMAEDDKPRELVKFNHWEGAPDKMSALDDDLEPFDQFKGRSTNYNWELYSTQLPSESSLTKEQIKKAAELERQIKPEIEHDGEAKEELLFSAVVRSPPKQNL